MSRTGEDSEAAAASRETVSRETLVRMATSYLARHAASTQRLREVLARKVRRRCEARDLAVPDEDDIRAMVDTTVAHLVHLGLVDDEAYARGRARTLAAKGWPAWRIRTDLQRQEIDPASEALAEAVDLDAMAQARRYAERKRLGPFRAGARADFRDKDTRSLVRAGFPVSVARVVIEDAEP